MFVMKFVCVISNVYITDFLISLQLNLDLDVMEFVLYCNMFLIGTHT